MWLWQAKLISFLKNRITFKNKPIGTGVIFTELMENSCSRFPFLHSKSMGRQKTKEVRIDNSYAWQKIFIKSLESSYRSSPYFEFYEDDIMEVFEKPFTYLLDLNIKGHEIMSSCLQLDNNILYTDTYKEIYTDIEDYRFLVEAKKQPVYDFKSYTQVFDNKYGFIGNLSILDLLFHEGTNALTYLEAHARLLTK